MSAADDAAKAAVRAAMDRARSIATELRDELRRTSGLDLGAYVSLEPSGPLVTLIERTPTGDVVRKQWTPDEARKACHESKCGRPLELKPYAPPPGPERGTMPDEVRDWWAEWKRTGRVPKPLGKTTTATTEVRHG